MVDRRRRAGARRRGPAHAGAVELEVNGAVGVGRLHPDWPQGGGIQPRAVHGRGPRRLERQHADQDGAAAEGAGGEGFRLATERLHGVAAGEREPALESERPEPGGVHPGIAGLDGVELAVERGTCVFGERLSGTEAASATSATAARRSMGPRSEDTIPDGRRREAVSRMK